jgi:hypothetical protein
MVLFWITGANVNKGLSQGTVEDVKTILLNYITKNPEVKRKMKKR